VLAVVAGLSVLAGAGVVGGMGVARAAVLTVTTANDSGPGSLRAAVAAAANGDTITFSSRLNGTPILITSGEIDTGTSMTITGNGPAQTIIDGSNKNRVLGVVGGTVSISGVTIRNGLVALTGVNESIAAGLLVEGGATLSVADTAVTGNTVTASAPGAFALGGGLAALSGGHLTVVRSTVSGNRASATVQGADAEGGGIEADSSTSLTVLNSTVSGNTATNVGGGIVVRAAKSVTVTSDTIAGNASPQGSGIGGSGGAVLQDTIVSNTGKTNCSAAITSRGHNLDSGTSCGFTGAGDLGNTDPRLGPLQGNGGATLTQALPAGSPAIGAGGACPAVDGGTDQRAVRRKTPCDIGAFETSLSVTPSPAPTRASNPAGTSPNTAAPSTSAPSATSAAPTTSTPGVSTGGTSGTSTSGAIPSPSSSAVPPRTEGGGSGPPQRRGPCPGCPPNRSLVVGSVEDVRQVSTSGTVLLTNVLLAAGLLVLIPFPSELFDSTLKAHPDEVRRWFRFIPLRHGRRRLSAWIGSRWVAFPLFTLAAAALYSLLDPGLGLTSPSLALYLGLVVALVVVTLGFNLPGLLHLRFVHGEMPRLRVLPWTLPIAAACVLVSRLADVHPGYVYGLLAGYTFEGEFSKRAEGRAAAFSTAVLFVLSIIAWLAWTPVKAAAEQPGAGFGVLVLDAMLAMIFVVGLETMAFGLVPLRFLDGEKIVSWSRLVWALLFAAGVFGLLHVLLNPSSGYLATARGGVVTLILLFAAFGTASFAMWAYFRYRRSK
jgi:hypothetical protein